ncbi:MAG: sulfite exporter TauE/SafE family protein [Polaribacter sp.]|nr:sulfite exporter TauE/SafE family protein [Polaribacter sp.]MDG1994312.1 sulfite exporter TauE/SafE family protein [Polaribacter sp.]
MLDFILLIVVGFIAGFINTIAGGGSLLTLPVLIFLGLPPNVANGTNRIGIVIQMLAGSAGFKSKGITTFPFSIYMGVSALIGSLIGAQIAVDIKGETFNKVLSFVMIAVVLIIAFKPKLKTKELLERTTGKHLWISCVAFFIFGIYGGFINAGLGFVLILFMHFFNRLSLVKSNATKAIIIIIYMSAALMVFVLNDKVNWKMGLIMAIGTSLGAWFSSRFSVKKGDGFIKLFLVIVVSIMAIKLWFF